MKRLLSTFLAAAMLLTSAAFTAVQAAPAESANLQNVTGAFALTDSTKLVEFDGTHLVVECDKTEDTANSTIALYIDSGYTKRDPMTVSSVPSNGNAYDNNRLPEGHHTVLVKTTGTVNVKGVYAKSEKLGESMSLGFEDTKKLSDGAITVVGNGGNTLDLVEGADGSSQALDVKLVNNAGEIVLPINLTLDREYILSAKIKPITVPDGNTAMLKGWLFQHIPGTDQDTGYTQYTFSMANGGVTLPVGEWSTVSTTLKPTATSGNNNTVENYGRIALRFGSTNSNAGGEFVIDDITLRPKTTQAEEANYALNLDFNNGQPENTDMNSSYTFENGYLQAQVWKQHTLMTVKDVLLKPNTTYKISYKYQGLTGECVGAYMKTIIDRGGYHYQQDGKTQSKSQLTNIETEPFALTCSGNWETVTRYFTTSNIKAVDEFGYAKIYFRFAYDENFNTVINGKTVKFRIDDLVIEPVDGIPNGAWFEQGQRPYINESAPLTAEYNEVDNALDVNVASGGNSSDVNFGLGIDSGKKYVLSFDVKGDTGLKLRPVVQGSVGSDGTYFNCNDLLLNGEWQKYSYTFGYPRADYTGVHTYPTLIIRAFEGTGAYKIKNIRCVEKPAAGVYNISAANLTEKKTATLTFDDYAADSKGYTYTVYAKNAAGDKTVYAAGALAGRSVSFDVLAAAGVRLYAEVAAIAADGSMSAYTESEIGTVAEGEKTFTISHEAYDGENPFVVNVTNNGTKRTIKLLAAEYDEDGILVAGHIKSFALEPNSENKLELEFTPDPDKGTASIKCFAWDTNNKPFFGAVEY